MRRWNGWGEEGIDYPVPASGRAFLLERLGPGQPFPDADLATVLAQVPPSPLAESGLIRIDADTRLRHTRGQSLPDWIALRSGRINCFPAAVAFPRDDSQVRQLLDFAVDHQLQLIPYGGGTSVVGHINPLPADPPALTVDLTHMRALINLDPTSRLATFEAGVRGPDLEHQLLSHGYTLGHFPQSFEYSTLGGWIATRSCGQQSCHYGRIEHLFAGGHLETAMGPLDLPPLPASAAGPDLRHWILGSEGRMGVLTRAIVRLHPLPRREAFYGVLLPDWISGLEAVRRLTQADAGVSMLRLSDADETATTLALAGDSPFLRRIGPMLSLIGFGAQRCLLIYGITLEDGQPGFAGRQASHILRRHGGLPLGGLPGRLWQRSRFRMPYLRNTLWDLGYAVDTLETALPWSGVEDLAARVKQVLREGLQQQGERVHVMAHLSHAYPGGASVYFTLISRLDGDPDLNLTRWQMLKASASQTIVNHGGTISHQHGVGLDHRPYLAAEKGGVGLEWLRAAASAADPQGILNRGKLLP